MPSLVRKRAMLCLFHFDSLIHTKLHFAWSSISEIIRTERFFFEDSNNPTNGTDYFAEQNKQIGSIIAIAFMVIGGFMVFNGLIRDFSSFGFSRAFVMLMLILTYILLAVSEPGKTDVLQYAWVLQTSGGIAINTNQMYLCYLFPDMIGFQMGLNYAMKGFGSMLPQFWLMLVQDGMVSYKSIMWLWATLTILSFIIGLVILPWQVFENNDDDMPNVFQVWVEKTEV